MAVFKVFQGERTKRSDDRRLTEMLPASDYGSMKALFRSSDFPSFDGVRRDQLFVTFADGEVIGGMYLTRI